jgi:hypothetical protein
MNFEEEGEEEDEGDNTEGPSYLAFFELSIQKPR